ncbi:unnamed protein product [Pleuronectes platessa]|uniref:Uncharacterized protein n=1 Tax=Pleuronectes platessa TaxID=8262 RepID=A0A9N7VDN6_PLEPL|nr:unnamed protein product [Pleuronectes platessa]
MTVASYGPPSDSGRRRTRTSPSIIMRDPSPGSCAQSVHSAAGSWMRSAPQHRTAPSAGAWRRAGMELPGEPTPRRSRGSPPPNLPTAAELCTRRELYPSCLTPSATNPLSGVKKC